MHPGRGANKASCRDSFLSMESGSLKKTLELKWGEDKRGTGIKTKKTQTLVRRDGNR